ncbi:MAG: RHS repeat-associated core domain-containing protein [Thermoguttaceae bacterium]|nr:RHS repeat-associated core domain-containing protein [Thermoguttaceae bacterium]
MAGLSVSGQIVWDLADHLGSVRDRANTSGQVIDHLAYDSFGRVLAETNPANGDRFKFTAREYDAATGQYYYRARYYDAAIGRFLSEDPLGFAAGDLNLFRYVSNRPTVLVDPLGLEPNVAQGSIVDNHAFWKTASGIELTKRIEKARDYLKATVAKLSDIREKPGREAAMLRFILHNLDKVVFTPVGAWDRGQQADYSVERDEAGRLKKLTIKLRVFNVFNLTVDAAGNPWKPPETPVEIPLPGHMGMDEESMNALQQGMWQQAKRREEWLKEQGITAPRTEMWNPEQIAALMANELLHAMAVVGAEGYEYKPQWPPARIPGVSYEDGNTVMDFLGSFPRDRQYENPMAPDSIMHEIYYYGRK